MSGKIGDRQRGQHAKLVDEVRARAAGCAVVVEIAPCITQAWSSPTGTCSALPAGRPGHARPRRPFILDEAQDLSPMQCRAVGRRCETGSATVLGDLAQGTTPWATQSWERTLAYLGKPVADGRGARIETPRQGYRVPRQILDYASRLLPHVAPDVAAALSVRQAAGALDVRHGSDLPAEVVRASRDRLAQEGSVGVIAADATAESLGRVLTSAGIVHGLLGDTGDGQADDALGKRLTVVPASLAKGLEFDHVIAVEPAEIVAGEVRGLRRLYVVLTRAVSSLTLVHARDLPEPLRT